MQIFGRVTSLPHRRLAETCQYLLTTPTAGANDLSVAWNLIHDGRVPENWAECWFQRYGKSGSVQDFKDAMTAYHHDLREKPVDTYAGMEGTAGNFNPPAQPGTPAGGKLLVHALDLWSYSARLIWRHGFLRAIGPLARIATFDRNAPTLPAALADALAPFDPATQRPLMDAFFDEVCR